MPHCPSIVSILALAVYFDSISGLASKGTSRHWVETRVPKLTKCVYFFLTFCDDILMAIDNSADSVPRWRGLNPFTAYLAVEFTDGSKWEDISKVRHERCFSVYH